MKGSVLYLSSFLVLLHPVLPQFHPRYTITIFFNVSTVCLFLYHSSCKGHLHWYYTLVVANNDMIIVILQHLYNKLKMILFCVDPEVGCGWWHWCIFTTVVSESSSPALSSWIPVSFYYTFWQGNLAFIFPSLMAKDIETFVIDSLHIWT